MFALNSDTPVTATASIVIDRSPAAVFHFVGERFFANYPRWSPEVRELKQIGAGPVKVGTRARQIRVDLGHRSESIFAVTVFEPARRICFEGVSGPYRCDYRISGISSAGATQVYFTFELAKLALYLRPLEGVIRDAVRDGVQQTVRRLKQLVEAEEAGERPACPAPDRTDGNRLALASVPHSTRE